ncbi:MAG: response regulator [Myxococcota bacterium]
MAAQTTESLLPKGLLVAGLAFPFWHLLMPEDLVDWWPAWWLVAAAMVLPQTLSWLSPRMRRHERGLSHLALAALTAHFIVLASANDMHPIYAGASVANALNCAVIFSTRRGYLGFVGFTVALTATSFALSPDLLKLVYWSGLYVMFGFAYLPLRGRLRAEAKLERHHEDLERQVLERTRELAESNDQLRSEIREREQAEARLRDWQKLEALGRLAGGVAHDFNNLLTSITGFAELLHDRLPEGSSEAEDAEEICRAAKRAADLTRNLLAFSRQDTFEITRLDLNAALVEARNMLELMMGEDVDVVMDLAPYPVPIRTNKSQLDQMLVNFALNARDAMPEGGVLTFATQIGGRDGCETAGRERIACLSIADTGVGMDPETSERIFDPFFTTKDVGKGTGLGLAAVYGFVQQTEGVIHVSSEPGGGSLFVIEWPVDSEPAVEHQSVPVSALPETSRKHILVVDDEPSLLRIVSRVLREEGYDVRTAPDSQAALRVVKDGRHRIDLLLTDVVMPRISGMELAREAAKLRPELPVVLMTGYLDHPSLSHTELPDGPLLSKPFPPAELLARVRHAFDQPRVAAPPPA